MSEKRRDNKKRILRTGESQRKDGRYAYKYTDNNGVVHFVYSWKLDEKDRLPQGKRECPSLRALEKQIKLDLDRGIDLSGAKITVLQLVEKYTSLKAGVKTDTEKTYAAVINRLKGSPFGQKQITKVKVSDAKNWAVDLHKKSGLCKGTVKSYKSVMRGAFETAVEDDYIFKNPFQFSLKKIVKDDNGKREALTEEQENRFLGFIKNHEKFCGYYDPIFILFNTGLRISELCGLTFADVDMKNGVINIDHQLKRINKVGFCITETKSKAGMRRIPMTQSVYESFCRILGGRRRKKVEPIVDGKTGFLFLTERGQPAYNRTWEYIFGKICKEYNETYAVPLPKITPHICRHTFCSRMANAGMNPKALQYLMGHSDIKETLNVYAHTHDVNADEELHRIEQII
ncbi:MAG: site-specific integrase [Eubacterium sp.]|nr:site-specific integrase [Eubacterium sp.]